MRKTLASALRRLADQLDKPLPVTISIDLDGKQLAKVLCDPIMKEMDRRIRTKSSMRQP